MRRVYTCVRATFLHLDTNLKTSFRGATRTAPVALTLRQQSSRFAALIFPKTLLSRPRGLSSAVFPRRFSRHRPRSPWLERKSKTDPRANSNAVCTSRRSYPRIANNIGSAANTAVNRRVIDTSSAIHTFSKTSPTVTHFIPLLIHLISMPAVGACVRARARYYCYFGGGRARIVLIPSNMHNSTTYIARYR